MLYHFRSQLFGLRAGYQDFIIEPTLATLDMSCRSVKAIRSLAITASICAALMNTPPCFLTGSSRGATSPKLSQVACAASFGSAFQQELHLICGKLDEVASKVGAKQWKLEFELVLEQDGEAISEISQVDEQVSNLSHQLRSLNHTFLLMSEGDLRKGGLLRLSISDSSSIFSAGLRPNRQAEKVLPCSNGKEAQHHTRSLLNTTPERSQHHTSANSTPHQRDRCDVGFSLCSCPQQGCPCSLLLSCAIVRKSQKAQAESA